MTLYDADGRPLSVGARLGGGGEGSVYVLGREHVVKVYVQGVTASRVEKLVTLARIGDSAIRSVAAWPVALAYDAQRHPVGFVMPRLVGGAPIASAANPQARKRAFPQAGWGWLAHVGRNLAVSFEALHDAGVVIGDVNESNIVVASDARVRFIDVDSFQVSSGGVRYACDVGTPTYQPPELQGMAFLGAVRTPNHDRFGLAVLVFQLLCMGRHPWAGRYAGKDELSFEAGDVIARLPYAYGAQAGPAGFAPPADGVRMRWFPERIVELFERAFAKGANVERPSENEWAGALDRFEATLVRCPAASTHEFPEAMGACPWCSLERAGFLYFIAPTHAVARETLDIAEVERRLEEIPPPLQMPMPVATSDAIARGEPLAPRLVLQRRLWYGEVAASSAAALSATHWLAMGQVDLIGLALVAVLILTRPSIGPVRAQRIARLRAAEAAFGDAASEWRRVASGADIERKRADLRAMLDAYKGLPAKFQAERQALERDRVRLQMDAFLESALLADARIWRIGRTTRAVLRAYGIETAKDVDAQLHAVAIPGIKTSKRDALAKWVRNLKREFVFDPSKPIDSGTLDALARREQHERSTLERHLRGGPIALAREAADAQARLEPLRTTLAQAAKAVAQARADCAMLARW